eukprot:11705517-Alexandrium_andersonii.AAC.1
MEWSHSAIEAGSTRNPTDHGPNSTAGGLGIRMRLWLAPVNCGMQRRLFESSLAACWIGHEDA